MNKPIEAINDVNSLKYIISELFKGTEWKPLSVKITKAKRNNVVVSLKYINEMNALKHMMMYNTVNTDDYCFVYNFYTNMNNVNVVKYWAKYNNFN